MKTLFFLLTCLIALNLPGQCPHFQKYIKKGDDEMKKGSKAVYDTAIYAYSIAMRLCPDSTDMAQKRIVQVLKEIKKLKDEAEADNITLNRTLKKLSDKQKEKDEALKEAQIQRDAAQNERDQKEVALKKLEIEQGRTNALLAETESLKNEAQAALQKAQNLIDAYYFYEDKFALAFKNDKYYFIDKEGEAVTQLGTWDGAEQFEKSSGFAKVFKIIDNEVRHYFLDTIGNFFLTLNRSITFPQFKGSIALDLSRQERLLKLLFPDFSTVKYLVINYNYFPNINSIIKKFKNLEWLDLSDSQLYNLPESVVNLKKLKYLDLRNNPITETEQERIKTLLPYCKIEFKYGTTIERPHTSNYIPDYQYLYDEVKNKISKNNKQSYHWYNLSYYALFVDKPTEAIQAAQKALTLAPKKQSVETNLALGYLLDNQWAKAEAIYQRWKGKKFPDDKQWLCDDLFLKDISDLERAGVKHADFEKVKDFFKR